MKFASKSLLIAAAAVILSGCAKKPVRPDRRTRPPSDPRPEAAGTLAPTEVATTADQNTTLQPRDANIIETDATIRGLLQPVYFDFDRSSVKESERPKLQAAKDYLEKNPQYRLLVEGHCDWRGTSEYNLASATTARPRRRSTCRPRRPG